MIARESRPKPVEQWLEKEIRGKIFKLGRSLEVDLQDQIAKVIERHLDAFAWSASDMPGIDPDFLCHHLAMDKGEENSTRRGGRRSGTKPRNSSLQATSGKSSTLNGWQMSYW